jgi:hypothetical protein
MIPIRSIWAQLVIIRNETTDEIPSFAYLHVIHENLSKLRNKSS